MNTSSKTSIKSGKKPGKEPTLHSVPSFALLMGVARNQIERMIKAGAFTTETINGQIFLPAKTAVPEFNAARMKHAAKLREGAGAGKKRDGSKVAAHEAIFDAERRDKIYKSKLSELKYLKEAGDLVDANAVKKRAFETGRKIRDAVLLIPSRYAAEWACETDPHKLEVAMTRAFVETLDKLADHGLENLEVEKEGSKDERQDD